MEEKYHAAWITGSEAGLARDPETDEVLTFDTWEDAKAHAEKQQQDLEGRNFWDTHWSGIARPAK